MFSAYLNLGIQCFLVVPCIFAVYGLVKSVFQLMVCLQIAPKKPTESIATKPADIVRISRRARSRTDVVPTDVKTGTHQTYAKVI